MAERVPLDSLKFERDLYPRQDISEENVRRLRLVRATGREFDPIIACRATRVITDGVHRWTAARENGDADIAVEWRDYDDDAARLEAALRLNANHGLRLTTHDRLRAIEIGDRVGLREIAMADALAVPVSYLRSIKPRFATVSEAIENGGELRRKVPLKSSVRHLSGQQITPEQEKEIMGSAPGNSYLLLVRQLMNAINLNLLPPESQHPALYVDLRQLGLKIAGL